MGYTNLDKNCFARLERSRAFLRTQSSNILQFSYDVHHKNYISQQTHQFSHDCFIYWQVLLIGTYIYSSIYNSSTTFTLKTSRRKYNTTLYRYINVWLGYMRDMVTLGTVEWTDETKHADGTTTRLALFDSQNSRNNQRRRAWRGWARALYRAAAAKPQSTMVNTKLFSHGTHHAMSRRRREAASARSDRETQHTTRRALGKWMNQIEEMWSQICNVCVVVGGEHIHN